MTRHVNARGAIETTHPQGAITWCGRTGLEIALTKRIPAPYWDNTTAYVFKDLLGMSDSEDRPAN